MRELTSEHSPRQSDKGPRKLPGSWIPGILVSETCHLLALHLFMGILVIGGVVFVPAYMERKASVLLRLEDRARVAILTAAASQGGAAAASMLDIVVASDDAILGLVAWDNAGNQVGAAGVTQGIALPTAFDPTSDSSIDIVDRDDAAFAFLANTGIDGIDWIGVHLDSDVAAKELNNFIWRKIGLVLVIAAFISTLALLFAGHIVIRPMFIIRDRLLQLQRDPNNVDLRVEGECFTREFTEMADAFNDHLADLARSHGDAISSREQRFSDFAESSSDWFWEMDDQLRFSYFSERFTEVTGVPEDALLGKTRRETGIPDVDPVAWQQHLEALDMRQPFRNFVHPRRKRNGDVAWVSISGRPVFDRNGQFHGFRGTGFDITPLRVAEEAMEEARRAAEQANKAKSDFLAAMSHELRTPLNAIIGFSEATQQQIAGPIGSAQYLEYAGYIQSSGQHLLHLVNQILDLSKVEAGKTELEEERFPIDECVDDALLMIDSSARAKNIAVEVSLPRQPRELWADVAKMRQTLINLLANAVKFTPEGGTITVSAERAVNGEFLLHVTDTGVGMATEDLETAMSAFGQVRSDLTRSQEGTGLGLSICRAFIELHGGSLELESELGKGTTVTVRLPAMRTIDVAPLLSAS